MINQIGVPLKLARENQTLTQEEVATKLYVTRQTVSRWEQNKTIPNIYILKELSQLYQIPIDELTNNVTTESTEELTNPKKRIHLFPLIGVFVFNLYLLLGISIVSFCVITIGWFLAGVFSVSPILLITVNLMGLQLFTWHQLLLSFLLCLVGITGLFLLKKLTVLIYIWGKKYILFNYKSVWY